MTETLGDLTLIFEVVASAKKNQMCHLPESNERSSHYKCDALPLGQGGLTDADDSWSRYM